MSAMQKAATIAANFQLQPDIVLMTWSPFLILRHAPVTPAGEAICCLPRRAAQKMRLDGCMKIHH
jgi:hypothetical protein